MLKRSADISFVGDLSVHQCFRYWNILKRTLLEGKRGFMDRMEKEKVNIIFLFQENQLVEVKYNFVNFAIESLFNTARKAEHISKGIVVPNALKDS